MAEQILLGPGARPPPAPAGFHWVVVNVILSDTGGGTLWELQPVDEQAAQWLTGLQQEFTAGMLSFLQSLSSSGGAQGRLGKTRPVAFFNYTNTVTPMKWKADRDYNFLGAWVGGGWESIISIYPLVNPIGTDIVPTIRDGVIVATTATTPGFIGTIPKIPVAKDTTLYVWMKSQLGVITIYLEDAS